MIIPEEGTLSLTNSNDPQERTKLYRFAISTFLKDDWKVAHRLLNSITHAHESQSRDLLKKFTEKTSDPLNSPVIQILKLCHGKISDFFQSKKYDDANEWSRLLMNYTSKLDNKSIYNHFLELHVRSLFPNIESNALLIEELYTSHKKMGRLNLTLSYVYLLQSFKNPNSKKEDVQSVLLHILESKELKSEGITKLVLYEVLKNTLLENNDSENRIPYLTFAIHLIKQILNMPLSSTFTPNRVYLYQYMSTLMITLIELSPPEEMKWKAEELITFFKEDAIKNIQDSSEETQIWFEQMLFNVGLNLSSNEGMKKVAFDCFSMSGAYLFPKKSSTNQVISCLAAIGLGLELNLIQECELLINKSLSTAENVIEDWGESAPNILSTIYLKRVQVALKASEDPQTKILKIIDECLQEPRLPGETMELINSILKSQNQEFQRPRIRCLKSALNKSGVNRSDLNHGIHVFIELFKELLTPSASETIQLAEIKSIINKLVERLEDVSGRSKELQDCLFYIFGYLWNYSWKLEFLDSDTPYGEVLRDMSLSLRPFIPTHGEYLDMKIKKYNYSNIDAQSNQET
nr:uncharacterized protein LOC121114577 isoform X2 [Lepeophtheirus salmonis]